MYDEASTLLYLLSALPPLNYGAAYYLLACQIIQNPGLQVLQDMVKGSIFMSFDITAYSSHAIMKIHISTTMIEAK